MRQLSAFIFDRKYSVPTLRLDVTVEPGTESDVARRILEEDRSYEGVELRDGEELVVAVGREDFQQSDPRNTAGASR